MNSSTSAQETPNLNIGPPTIPLNYATFYYIAINGHTDRTKVEICDALIYLNDIEKCDDSRASKFNNGAIEWPRKYRKQAAERTNDQLCDLIRSIGLSDEDNIAKCFRLLVNRGYLDYDVRPEEDLKNLLNSDITSRKKIAYVYHCVAYSRRQNKALSSETKEKIDAIYKEATKLIDPPKEPASNIIYDSYRMNYFSLDHLVWLCCKENNTSSCTIKQIIDTAKKHNSIPYMFFDYEDNESIEEITNDLERCVFAGPLYYDMNGNYSLVDHEKVIEYKTPQNPITEYG